MTSSNETYRKSRLFTGLAIGTALLATGVFGYLLMRVNSLETEFGDLRANRARIEREITAGKSMIIDLQGQISRFTVTKNGLVSQISIQQINIKSNISEAARLKVGLETLSRSIAEKQKMLTTLTDEVTAAKNLIAEKGSVEKALVALRGDVSEARDTTNGLTREINQLGDDKASAQTALQIALGQQQTLQDSVKQLERKKNQLLKDVDAQKNALDLMITEKVRAQKLRDIALNDESAARSRAIEQGRLADAAERRLKQATDNLNQVETTLSTKGLEKGRLETEVGGLEQQIKGLTKQVGSLRTDKNQIKGALNSVKTQLKDKNTLLENITSDLASRQRDLANTEKSLSNAQVSLGTVQNSLARKQEKLAATQIKRAAEEERLVTVTDSVKTQEKRLNELGDLIAGTAARIKAVKGNLAIVKTEVEGERQALDTARKNRLAAEAEESGIRVSIIEAKKHISVLQDDLSSLNAKIDGQKSKESKAREKADNALKELASAEGKLSALQSLIPTLELQKADLERAVKDLKQRKAVLEPLPEAIAPPANTSGTSGPSKGGNN